MHLSGLNGSSVLNCVYERGEGCHLSIKGTCKKGVLFLSNMVQKVRGLDLGAKPSRIKFCSVSPWAYKFNRFWKGSVKGQCLTLLYFGLIFIQYCSTTAAF